MVQEEPLSGLALYYPSIHFSDEDWLRSAFLSWHRLARIAPQLIVPGDSADVRFLAKETDFLRAAYPTPQELDQIDSEFQQFIHDHAPELTARFAIVRNGELLHEISTNVSQEYKSLMYSNIGPEGMLEFPPSEHLSYVYGGSDWESGKISVSLSKTLIEMGLGINQSVRHDGRYNRYIGLHPRLAWVYICALAEIMASSRAFCPVTNLIAPYQAAGGGATLQGLADRLIGEVASISHQEQEEITSKYVHIALADVVPTGLSGVEMSRLIKFRERHQDEFLAFQRHLDSLGPRLYAAAEVADVDAFQDHLQVLYERETQPLLRDLRGALRAAGVSATGGTLMLKINTSGLAGTALGTAALATDAPAIVTGAGIAIAVVPFLFSNLQKWRRRKRDSPVSLLLSAERELGPQTLLRRLFG